MNGNKCGELVFRNEEFIAIRQLFDYNKIMFLPDKRLTKPASLITFFNDDTGSIDGPSTAQADDILGKPHYSL
jgi:hypothetical protein